MPVWRVVSTTAVAVAVCGCAAAVVGFAAAQPRERAAKLEPLATPTTPHLSIAYDPPSTAPLSSPRSTRARTTASTPAPSRPATRSRPQSTSRPAPPPPKPKPRPKPSAPRGQALPLPYSTGSASRIVTVVAPSTTSTTAVVQAWNRAPGGGWLRHGSPMNAHVGSQGLTTHPSESRSATPIGSFTLTQAFGALADPGTALPYFRTDAADWWVSDASSRYYNTHYRCGGNCPFDTSAGENLRAAGWVYDYAVVIDYNRFPVRAGAGSAFFLHVTDGGSTAGCVAVPQSRLVTLMQWLTPAAHPRIVIGVA